MRLVYASRATASGSRTRSQQKEALQQEIFQLLNNVEGASSGDLTVRAQVTTSEIGIVAEFFNSIVESLRDIVIRVKQGADEVNIAAS